MLTRYTPSGKYTMSFLTMLPTMVGAAVGIGAAYQILITLLPHPKILFLLCLGAAAGMGVAGGFVMRLSKCRSTRVAFIGGAIGGLLCVLAGHVVAFYAINMRRQSDHLSSVSAGEYIDQRVTNGWVITSRSSGYKPSGSDISGAMVWVCWGIEAAVFFVTSGAVAGLSARKPFCENCQRWVGRPTTKYAIPSPRPEVLSTILAADEPAQLIIGPESSVSPLPPVPTSKNPQPKGAETNALIYELASCPTCRDSNYLAVSLATTRQTGKKAVESKTAVVHHDIWLNAAQAEGVRTLANAMSVK